MTPETKHTPGRLSLHEFLERVGGFGTAQETQAFVDANRDDAMAELQLWYEGARSSEARAHKDAADLATVTQERDRAEHNLKEMKERWDASEKVGDYYLAGWRKALCEIEDEARFLRTASEVHVVWESTKALLLRRATDLDNLNLVPSAAIAKATGGAK